MQVRPLSFIFTSPFIELICSLFFKALQPDTSVIPMNSLGAGVWQALVNVKPQPENVIVTSSLGGVASAPVVKGA
jgi:hypothetical protein